VALLGGSLAGVRVVLDHGASPQLEHFRSPPVHVAVKMDVACAPALMQGKGPARRAGAPSERVATRFGAKLGR
jgi:hypothetical protein